jgi:hypothetical protein
MRGGRAVPAGTGTARTETDWPTHADDASDPPACTSDVRWLSGPSVHVAGDLPEWQASRADGTVTFASAVAELELTPDARAGVSAGPRDAWDTGRPAANSPGGPWASST